MKQNIKKNDWLMLGAAVVILFMLGVLGRIYYPRLSGWLQNYSEQAKVLNAGQTCNPVNKICIASDSALAITLKLGERVQSLTPFPVVVGLTGYQADTAKAVAVYFAMADMDMGFNRFDLSQDTDGAWHGSAILPVCTARRQDWRVTVTVASDTPYTAVFYLLAHP